MKNLMQMLRDWWNSLMGAFSKKEQIRPGDYVKFTDEMGRYRYAYVTSKTGCMLNVSYTSESGVLVTKTLDEKDVKKGS